MFYKMNGLGNTPVKKPSSAASLCTSFRVSPNRLTILKLSSVNTEHYSLTSSGKP